MNGHQAKLILTRFYREIQREVEPLNAHPFRKTNDYENPESRKAVLEAANKFLSLVTWTRHTISGIRQLNCDDLDPLTRHFFACFSLGFMNGVLPLYVWTDLMSHPEVDQESWRRQQSEFTLEICLGSLNEALRKCSSQLEAADLQELQARLQLNEQWKREHWPSYKQGQPSDRISTIDN